MLAREKEFFFSSSGFIVLKKQKKKRNHNNILSFFVRKFLPEKSLVRKKTPNVFIFWRISHICVLFYRFLSYFSRGIFQLYSKKKKYHVYYFLLTFSENSFELWIIFSGKRKSKYGIHHSLIFSTIIISFNVLYDVYQDCFSSFIT